LTKVDVGQPRLFDGVGLDGLFRAWRKAFQYVACLASKIVTPMPRVGWKIEGIPFLQHMNFACLGAMKCKFAFETIIGFSAIVIGLEIR
jgi:hypothetical protein